MYMMKRLLCLMLAGALLLCIAWTMAGAEDTADYTFSLDESGAGYIVTGYTGSASSLTVPDWYQGKPVTEIGAGAFRGNTAITSVSLPSSIKVIGSAAFKGCSALTTLKTYTAAAEPPAPARIPGDADDNGRVEIHDALLIMKRIAGWSVQINLDNADVNESGSVNVYDAQLILQFCAGADVTLK